MKTQGNPMKTASGFTLIELMIVVAIISILAAIALSAYQDHVARVQVSEGLSLAGGAKTSVATHYMARSTFPADNRDAGLALPGSISSQYVQSVTVGNGTGVIQVLYGNSANSRIQNLHLVLEPMAQDGSMQWRCSSPDLARKQLPSSCR